ncbi:MAG TPA: NAD-dependent epimerase/dehydratase family protein [Bacteroidales bacterium]|nr:NAD-dependent epimerase/dehydratase family protein [Bacteroidales bacterium]
MKIAVTGANGHVGVNLCKALADAGHEINALVHMHDQALQGIQVKLFKGDLLQRDTLLPFLTGVEVVFHLAAKISITGDPTGVISRINTDGTRNMVETAKICGVRRFIHFSSIHAFRQHPLGEPLDETRPLVEKEGFAYDRSKAGGERAVMEAHAQGMDVVVLSPTAIIGPADTEPSLTGTAVIDIIRGKIPALVPGGYDWVDVRDVVKAAIASIEHGRSGEKYLISGHWHSLKELSGLIGRSAGRRTVSLVLPIWVARLGLPFIGLYSRLTGSKPLYTRESLTIISEGNRRISHAKAARDLGHQPKPLNETISDLVNWFKNNDYLKK